MPLHGCFKSHEVGEVSLQIRGFYYEEPAFDVGVFVEGFGFRLDFVVDFFDGAGDC